METDTYHPTSAPSVSKAWGQWVAQLGDWHVFGGLTYNPKGLRGRPGSDVVRAHVRRWLGRDAEAAGIRVEAGVVAIEYHRSGWPHCHPLLRVQGGSRSGLLGELTQLWFTKHGFARLERPRSPEDVAEYAAKYLAKDLGRGDVIFWPPRGSLGVHQARLGRVPRVTGAADRRELGDELVQRGQVVDPWSPRALGIES